MMGDTSDTAVYINRSNGQVGINDTDPSAMLTVKNSNNSNTLFRLRNSGNTTLLAMRGDGDLEIPGAEKTPASAGASGATGEIAWDSDYIYVCVAANTWKRVAISTW